MAEVANKFNLDSTYFVAFEMAHEALRRGLEQASDLNITQYRILTKLMQASAPVSQGELGKILGMKPNGGDPGRRRPRHPGVRDARGRCS